MNTLLIQEINQNQNGKTDLHDMRVQTLIMQKVKFKVMVMKGESNQNREHFLLQLMVHHKQE